MIKCRIQTTLSLLQYSQILNGTYTYFYYPICGCELMLSKMHFYLEINYSDSIIDNVIPKNYSKIYIN